MLAMAWDDRLTSKAQAWADRCIDDHDPDENRISEPYRAVGQNQASGAGIRESVKAWYDEVTKDKFVYQGHKCGGVCGHYTQVVWWNSWNLGCGQNQCPGQSPNVFCNYAPSGNVRKFEGGYELIYESGRPCTKCPSGFGFCMDDALCASYKQCSASNSICRCTIRLCRNGGQLNKRTCSCSCPRGFTGLRCEEPCEDKNEYCDQQRQQCAWDSKYYETTTKQCLKTCNACGPITNPRAANTYGIATRILDLDDDVKCDNVATDRACERQSSVCRQNVAWATHNCARFCGFCKAGPKPKPTEGPGPGPEPRTDPPGDGGAVVGPGSNAASLPRLSAFAVTVILLAILA